jgi:hypothetical protein
MFAHFLLWPLSVLGFLSLAGIAAWGLCGYFGGVGWKPLREPSVDYHVLYERASERACICLQVQGK